MDASLKQLFQQEFAKMVAVISRRFGLEHIEIAEDIVSETFLQAAETWETKGLPANPAAWLYAVAKQKTLYRFRREKIYADRVAPVLAREIEAAAEPAFDFSPEGIRDSQLQMIFAICTPAIASEAQIALALRILCGFSIDEISEAFLSRKDTINKRLFRAKEKLRTEGIKMELPPPAGIRQRLGSVLHIIYLLFSEGYYSRTHAQTLRQELCFEAMRLGTLLTGYQLCDTPETNALMALMCFHASRFEARRSGGDPADFGPVLYEQQNDELWDTQLIGQGMYFLGRSMTGEKITTYHLEARIASWHCIKKDTAEKWEAVLALYDQLLKVNYSPSAALNRVFALYKAQGASAALTEAERLKMEDSHFYHVLMGELYRSLNDKRAAASLEKASALAKTANEKAGIRRMLWEIQPAGAGSSPRQRGH